MKYLLEIEAEDKIAFAEELFRSMDFVKVLQVLPEKTTKKPREGWAEAAEQQHTLNDDKLLTPDIFEDENLDWWTWKE
ncbi:MAG: hypothetical protein LBR10_05610 [Prevotellaceae bacterium]|nr:hypothetical protein [Prevotellaceae bacterium]